jgi:lambda family phage portal protein
MAARAYKWLGTYREPRAIPFAAISAELDAATVEPTAGALDVESPRYRVNTGSHWPGGFGHTELLITDYWTLRQRSSELFQRNLFARGLIRRLVTNEINVGLHLEATPEEAILGKKEDELADWSEDVENRFRLWAENPAICDQSERLTFGALQAVARREALVAGDVLVVMRQDPRTRLPKLQLISGDAVQTPMKGLGAGVRCVHGVELDDMERHVAFWVTQRDGTSKRIPAFGEKTGRRLAWLVYGTDKRVDEVRGQPLLGIVLQSLKELDRYRDAALRKAVIGSMFAIFVEKTEQGPGSNFARRVGVPGVAADTTTGQAPPLNVSRLNPGIIVDHLAAGEKPTPFSNQTTDINYPKFEEAVVAAIAWCFGIPPEILTLSFSSNYSASQAAINEFKIYLNLVRTEFGEQFCQYVYVEWLLASALSKKIQAPGLLEAFRDYTKHDLWGAWVAADWAGHIKPAVDMSKLVGGYAAMVEQGFMTRARATRELTGMKYSKVSPQLKRENAQLAEANEPLAKLEAAKKPEPAPFPPAGGDEPADEPDDEPPPAKKKDEPAGDAAELDERPN